MFSELKTRKLANAIIYFLDSGITNLGTTKLMKLFFYADKEHLQRFGVPIFKTEYTKLPNGPVPLFAYSLIKSMNQCDNDDVEQDVNIIAEYIETSPCNRGGYDSTRFAKKKDVELSYFSKSELSVLSEVVEKYKYSNAKEMSDQSHELSEYKQTSMSETIPFHRMVTDEVTRNYVKEWELASI